MTKVLCIGGGSVGHLAPIVAVAEALREKEPGIDIHVVCSDRPADAAFLKLEGFDPLTVPLPRRSWTLPLNLFRGLIESGRILERVAPDVVFSKGGAVSIPMVIAAKMRGIPVVLHESDAVTGRANRILSLFATRVCLGSNEKDSSLEPRDSKLIVTGNPVRRRITQGKKDEGLRMTRLSGQKPILLVWGGSQGAHAINEAITKHLDELLRTVDIIHLTGEGKKKMDNRAGYWSSEFGSDVLPHLLACSSFAVSRAGAGSIAELSACNVPMILIPIEGLAADHQVKNARAAEAAGVAVVLRQERIETLPSIVSSILQNPITAQTMRERPRYAHHSEAARLIAETVLQSVARHGSHQ